MRSWCLHNRQITLHDETYTFITRNKCVALPPASSDKCGITVSVPDTAREQMTTTVGGVDGCGDNVCHNRAGILFNVTLMFVAVLIYVQNFAPRKPMMGSAHGSDSLVQELDGDGSASV